MKHLFLSLLLMLVAFTTNAQDDRKINCPDNHHPHMIDLGLPSGTKWACCNVDENYSKQSPTNYGSYYAWGEIEEKSVYNPVTYRYATGVDEDGDGYYNDMQDLDVWGICQNLGSDIAGTQYDVAHVQWGGSWVMPSEEQIKELLDNCSFEWDIVDDIECGKFTSKTNNNSVYIPASGSFGESEISSREEYPYVGHYWTSTSSKYQGCACALNFSMNGWIGILEISPRCYGNPVRPVSK